MRRRIGTWISRIAIISSDYHHQCCRRLLSLHLPVFTLLSSLLFLFAFFGYMIRIVFFLLFFAFTVFVLIIILIITLVFSSQYYYSFFALHTSSY